MPQTVTDVSTFTDPILSPSSGEARTAAGILQPVQGLANRTRILKNRLDAVTGAGASSVRQLQNVSTTTALKGITLANRADRDVCLVDGIGLFEFRAAQIASSDVAPFIYIPNDQSPPNTGAWVFVSSGVSGVAGGLALLDSTARLAAASQRNGIIAMPTLVNVGLYTGVTSGNVTGYSLTVSSAQTGDVIILLGSVTLYAAASQYTQVQLQGSENGGGAANVSGGAANVGSSTFPVGGNTLATAALFGIHTIGTAGNYVVTLAYAAGATSSFFTSPNFLIAVQLRP